MSCTCRIPTIWRGLASPSTRLYSTSRVDVSAFHESNAAVFLAAATSEESIPRFSGPLLPEVVVAGRANVGKSTLLNAILGRKDLVRTSKKAGRTRALNFFRVGKEPGKLVLVDTPGYGMRGRAEWGKLWEHYVDTRPQLRQICLLINGGHGITDFDKAMLSDLETRLSEQHTSRKRRPVLLPIVTKFDTLTSAESMQEISEGLKELAPTAQKPIFCAIRPGLMIGVTDIQHAMSEACLEK